MEQHGTVRGCLKARKTSSRAGIIARGRFPCGRRPHDLRTACCVGIVERREVNSSAAHRTDSHDRERPLRRTVHFSSAASLRGTPFFYRPENNVPRHRRQHLDAGSSESIGTFALESAMDGKWLIGQGVATAYYPYLRLPAKVRVCVCADGTAIVRTHLADMRTSSSVTLSTSAALFKPSIPPPPSKSDEIST